MAISRNTVAILKYIKKDLISEKVFKISIHKTGVISMQDT